MAEAVQAILPVDIPDVFEVAREGEGEGSGEDGNAVFVSLSVSHGDSFGFEVEILDPEADALHKAHA